MAMNKYGQQALQHWRRWRPHHLAAIAAAEGEQAYFTRLGEQVAAEIAQMAASMAAAANAELSSDHHIRTGQLNMIRNDAEQAVLRERVLLPPEPGAAPDGAPLGDEVGDEVDGEGDGRGGGAAESTDAGWALDSASRGDAAADEEFEDWKADTLAALAGGRLVPTALTREELTLLREETDNPRLLELAGIGDEDLRRLGLV
jgi:hypothetical protein